MKIKTQIFSSQILILFLFACFAMLTMIQVAEAQSASRNPNWGDSIKNSFKKMGLKHNQNGALIAQAANRQSQSNAPSNVARGNSLHMKMPQKSGIAKMLENFSLSYYHQFLGPTVTGTSGQTYNVYQEAINKPGSGQAPMQSFQSMNLRYQINDDWAIGTTLALANGYTDDVNQPDGSVNKSETLFFNARAYVSLPSLRTPIGTFFTTVAFEAPTSNISKEDDMTYGYFISESFALNLPNSSWMAGINGSYYRINYKNDVKIIPGQDPIQLQTAIINVGPYLNYRVNDSFQLGSTIVFDWDQKGVQTSSREFGGNLSDRARLTGTYFPNGKIPYLTSVGVFAQALLNYSSDTTALGAEFALRF